MADYGINKRFIRAKAPMQVLIGFSPTEPVKLSSLAAPLDLAVGGVAIKSGMAIVKDSGTVNGVAVTEGFRNAEAADATNGKAIYIALHDADSHDVQASGKLVGLDCSDKYEVLTGYFAAGTYALDDPLYVGADGVFTNVAPAPSSKVVGYISAVGTGNGLFVGGKTPSALDMNMIRFKTAQNGQLSAGA
jgi:hypothetical protein